MYIVTPIECKIGVIPGAETRVRGMQVSGEDSKFG